MEALIRPDFGLTFWTLLIFGLLVLLLSKTVWKPVLQAAEQREKGLRDEREAAEKARAEAERASREIEERLAGIKAEMQARLREATEEGERAKVKLLDDARKGVAAMLESAARDLQTEREKIAAELRNSFAEFSLMSAEKVLSRSVDRRLNEEIVGKAIKELEAKKA
ncbi:MAG TPA: F0F1 ATP synthase subunit B [Elusimicrobiales bacterium]|nr:F0F1 ATP synthase subunit B [Elusimicrobiales bacterium]